MKTLWATLLLALFGIDTGYAEVPPYRPLPPLPRSHMVEFAGRFAGQGNGQNAYQPPPFLYHLRPLRSRNWRFEHVRDAVREANQPQSPIHPIDPQTIQPYLTELSALFHNNQDQIDLQRDVFDQDLQNLQRENEEEEVQAKQKEEARDARERELENERVKQEESTRELSDQTRSLEEKIKSRKIDLRTIPDPASVPYHFRSPEGAFKETIVSTYKNLFKANPQFPKQQNAREFGLMAVEEADQSFALGDGKTAEFYKDLSLELLDITIGLDPVTGIGRSAYEFFLGKNLITGKPLDTTDRTIAFLGIATAGSGRFFAQAARGFGKILANGMHVFRERQVIMTSLREAEHVLARAGGIFESAELLAQKTPDLGQKLDYVLGKASGSLHNVERSQEMLRQMERIGLPDSQGTRTYLADHLKRTFDDPTSILKAQDNGRIVRESLLNAPRGNVKIESIWQDAKLITVKIFGGGK